MAAADYQEVVNFSFVDEEWELDFAGQANPIRLLNPIASQLAVMRSTLLGSLAANVRFNLNRKLARVRLFEVGRCSPRSGRGRVSLRSRVSGSRCGSAGSRLGRRSKSSGASDPAPVDFFDVKGDVEALVARGRRGS